MRAELFSPLLLRHKAPLGEGLQHPSVKTRTGGWTDTCAPKETGKASQHRTPSLPLSQKTSQSDPTTAFCCRPFHRSPGRACSPQKFRSPRGWVQMAEWRAELGNLWEAHGTQWLQAEQPVPPIGNQLCAPPSPVPIPPSLSSRAACQAPSGWHSLECRSKNPGLLVFLVLRWHPG